MLENPTRRIKRQIGNKKRTLLDYIAAAKEDDCNAFESERESSGCQSITEGPSDIAGTASLENLNERQSIKIKRRKVSSTIDRSASATLQSITESVDLCDKSTHQENEPEQKVRLQINK